MSGLEIPGLVFGVVPIFVEILKAYGQAGERLATFKRYNKAVVDIQLDFRLEESAFRNECRHLLASVVPDEQDLQNMLQHTDSSQWNERDVNDRLRKLLGHDYGVCEEVVVRIRDKLRYTTAHLADLGRISTAASQTDSAADVFRHLRDAFNVSAKENRYKKTLHDLRTWNAKFRRLRKQKCGLQSHGHFSSTSIVSRTIPSSYSTIREASKTLHYSLGDAWSCSNKYHEAHQAKLWLNANVDYGRVRLNMAISCRRKSATTPPSMQDQPPIWLYVQSVTTKSDVPEPAQNLPPLVAGLMSPIQVQVQAQDPPQEKESKVGAWCAKIKKRTKRVRFDSETTKDDSISPPPLPKEIKSTTPQQGSEEQCYSMLNLRNTESFCCHLSGCKSSCLGFLESQDTFRFIFYDAGKRAAVGPNQPTNGREALLLNTKLSLLSPLQRLMLAHKLASSVLQYYSTPWLAEDWKLEDLAFFGNDTGSTSEQLAQDMETLHLSTQFPNNSHTEDFNPAGGPVSIDPSAEFGGSKDRVHTTHRYTYGIRNMTLAKLGLALLEIGHKKEIGSFLLGQQQHDVIGARILADSSHTELGPRYQRIARRCLECNFSAEDDLSDENLRNSVYSNVVCELKSMAEDYKRFLGAIA